MKSADEHFQIVVEQARNDPNVIGLFLSGSRGKGFDNEHSDWDVRLVFRDGTANTDMRDYHRYAQHPDVEIGTYTLSALRDYAALGSEFAWDRYSFAHVEAIIDKTGEVQTIIDAKGRLPDDVRTEYIRGMLDSYINSVYRSLKCHRARNRLGMRLEATLGIPALLATIFGLEGRHSPYLGYLEKELYSYPLQRLPLSASDLLEAIERIVETADITMQQRLLNMVEDPCRGEGMDDVFKAWGEAYPWMKTYKQ